jgi:hypothetical protein
MPTAAPGTTAPVTPAPSQTRTAAAVPSATSGRVTVVVVTPTPTPSDTASPLQVPVTSTPTGRVRITSDLPTGCGRLGQACRYAEAPAATRLGDGPASVTVTSPGQGALRVTATAGAGGSPGSVGFVVRVCRCTETTDDVLVEARVSLTPGSVLELQGISGPARIWVQELNEAGLSRGTAYDVPASTPPTSAPPS